jgi:hypothetical protein
MTRYNDILNGIKQSVEATQQTHSEDENNYPEIEYQDDRLSLLSDDKMENVEDDMNEYKQDFFQMSLGSIRSIAIHAQAIVDAVERGAIKDALTESWLQGKIAVTEDYMLTIHNFLMFGETETDTEGTEATEAAKNLPGLWENIRKKKERMGKKYKPAKPGDKDRPDSKQWKKLSK